MRCPLNALLLACCAVATAATAGPARVQIYESSL